MMSILRSLFLVLTGIVLLSPCAVVIADTPSTTETAEGSSSGQDETAAAAAASASEEGSEGEATDEEGDTYDKTLRWATASEVDNFGYDIYRGTSEEGPFERITEEPIAGAGTTDEPSYYSYVDRNLDATRDYYYYIESISMHGERERFTPVQKVAARKTDSASPTSSEDP